MNSLTEIEKLLQFDSSDLAANRMGQLSEKQRQRLQSEFIQQSIISVVAGIIFAALGYWFAFEQGETLLGAILIIIAIVMVVGIAALGRVSVNDLHAQKVSAYLKKLSQKRNRRYFYSLDMGDVSFSTDKEHYESFDEGTLYTFYYYQRQPSSWLRGAPTLLSVELGGVVSEEKKEY